REITHQLYGGDWENRLKQELLLGFGGVRALRALGINTTVYHCNEGHAAFMGLERLREYRELGLDFAEAIEAVRASSLFTTHTPVPAGHDSFSDDMLLKYLSHFPAKLGIDWITMMGLGKVNPNDGNEKFSMSVLAATCSQEVNGVSWLHGKVSQEIFSKMWPGYLPEELHISSVTNGVHYPTWIAPEWKAIHAEVFGDEFKTHHYDKSCFNGIYKVSDEVIWKTRNAIRKRLIDRVKKILTNPSETNHYTPKEVVQIKENLRDDVLTIGFARRFATYKRATLLFNDLDRLAEIVNDPKRPVQFLFAGKAHPADQAGQDLIKRIVDISKMPQFIGKIVFVPNYDISIAKSLVQGVDVWMNNPTRPLEASGTSGEKAAMNGVMHFSVLDGWWVEGYKEGAGWALPQESTYDDTNLQNELDAATIYQIIENEIAPAFYNKDRKTHRSEEWISYIKNTVAQVANNFTTNRMLSDYINKYYAPLAERTEKLVANDFALCKELAQWKSDMREHWSSIKVHGIEKPDTSAMNITLGKVYDAKVTVDIDGIDPDHIGVEIIFASVDRKGYYHITERHQFTHGEKKDGVVEYSCAIQPEAAGNYKIAARLFAIHPLMPHRQDFELVRWL
ncbi:MAG: alpha-glucan family phosphorylase, partial [Bacteroidales bacterium]|nr:alpha-glucan family phosphorylase [Bacteroidales bacterium]